MNLSPRVDRPLRGGCSCGRNRYVVTVPASLSADGSAVASQARVFFDSNSREHRRNVANPLTSWLRIPLSWYQSTTFSFFPDESHTAIRRAYSSPRTPHAIRYFCGFCGTPLSYWSEQPREEAEYINLTLGSLTMEDLLGLEDWGILPLTPEETEGEDQPMGDAEAQDERGLIDFGDGARVPWLEAMLEGSILGRNMSIERGRARAARNESGTGTRRTAEGEMESADGRVRVEWRIEEWDGAGEEGDRGAEGGEGGLTKRKRDDGSVSVG